MCPWSVVFQVFLLRGNGKWINREMHERNGAKEGASKCFLVDPLCSFSPQCKTYFSLSRPATLPHGLVDTEKSVFISRASCHMTWQFCATPLAAKFPHVCCSEGILFICPYTLLRDVSFLPSPTFCLTCSQFFHFNIHLKYNCTVYALNCQLLH